jgi:hypothetical protein
MDLERELSALEVAWPATPELRLEFALPPRRSWRPLAVAVALVLAAVAAAFAVPPSRGAILRFLHLGGVTIERVDQLPAAQERSLGAYLGPVVTRAQAEQALGGPLRLPPVEPAPPLHLGQSVVSLVFVDRGRRVLLSELAGTDGGILKKAISSSTSVVSLPVGGALGFFISGSEHVLLFPGAPPRLAGNVLLWQAGGLTLRLEGRGLTRARALELAGLLRGT